MGHARQDQALGGKAVKSEPGRIKIAMPQAPKHRPFGGKPRQNAGKESRRHRTIFAFGSCTGQFVHCTQRQAAPRQANVDDRNAKRLNRRCFLTVFESGQLRPQNCELGFFSAVDHVEPVFTICSNLAHESSPLGPLCRRLPWSGFAPREAPRPPPFQDQKGTALSFVDEVHHFVVDYGYLAVFLGILFEDFGFPTPGETMLIAGSVLASRGTLNILWLLPIAWLAAVIGDSIGFLIGAVGGHRMLVRYGGRIGITFERLQKVEEFFARYGDIVVVIARFFVILRQFNGVVAGTLEMPWPRFFLYNSIGAALWVGFWGGLTYWLGSRFFAFIHVFGWVGPTLIALGVLALIAAVAKFWWWRKLDDDTPPTGKPNPDEKP